MGLPAMPPREYVNQLYRLCLGRAPEHESLVAWTASIAAGDDPSALLAVLLASDEYRDRPGAPD